MQWTENDHKWSFFYIIYTFGFEYNFLGYIFKSPYIQDVSVNHVIKRDVLIFILIFISYLDLNVFIGS